MFKRVQARVQEIWGKEVATEAEAYAKAICEEIEKMNAGDGTAKPAKTGKKTEAEKDE